MTQDIFDFRRVSLVFFEETHTDVVGILPLGIFLDTDHLAEDPVPEDQRAGFDFLADLKRPQVQGHPHDTGKLWRNISGLEQDTGLADVLSAAEGLIGGF